MSTETIRHILGIFRHESDPKPCRGEINVGSIDHVNRTAEGELSEARFIERAVDDIAAYRFGRVRVFSNIELIPKE